MLRSSKTKRIAALLAAACMVMSAGACGDNNAATETETAETPAESTEAPAETEEAAAAN